MTATPPHERARPALISTRATRAELAAYQRLAAMKGLRLSDAVRMGLSAVLGDIHEDEAETTTA